MRFPSWKSAGRIEDCCQPLFQGAPSTKRGGMMAEVQAAETRQVPRHENEMPGDPKGR